jgi:hypothetical protein
VGQQVRGDGEVNELRKCAATQDRLRKAADLLGRQLDELDQRLARIEQEDEQRRSFLGAEAMAPVSANLDPAPEKVQ